jgi:hypothetical protein
MTSSPLSDRFSKDVIRNKWIGAYGLFHPFPSLPVNAPNRKATMTSPETRIWFLLGRNVIVDIQAGLVYGLRWLIDFERVDVGTIRAMKRRRGEDFRLSNL